jgi:hypothetical protein
MGGYILGGKTKLQKLFDVIVSIAVGFGVCYFFFSLDVTPLVQALSSLIIIVLFLLIYFRREISDWLAK